jgi:hypothetical protein
MKMTDDPYAIADPDSTQGLRLDALSYLQLIYRDPALSTAVRMRAAAFAIPYESPKLIATAVMNEGSFAELLDRRLERMKQMQLLENNGVSAETTIADRTIEPEPVRSPPLPSPLSRVYSNRFRRRI